jgi:hypothetical protein
VLDIDESLNRIGGIPVPQSGDYAFVRVLLKQASAFRDWDNRVEIYLARSMALDEDTATDAEKRWAYYPLFFWPSSHSEFLSDLRQALEEFTTTVTLPDLYSNLRSKVQSWISSNYPNPSNNYYMLGNRKNDDSSDEVVGYVIQTDDPATDPDTYNVETGEELKHASPYRSASAAAMVDLICAINDLIWAESEDGGGGISLEGQMEIPEVMNVAICKTVMILKFLKSSAGTLFDQNSYVDSVMYADLVSAADDLMIGGFDL